MRIERDTEGNILVRDKNDVELHPFVTTLAAIEFQQKIIPPRIPELSTQGWDVVIAALKEAIDNIDNTFKITDSQIVDDGAGHLVDVVSVEHVEDTMPKTPEMPHVENNPPSHIVPTNPPRKPIKPTYKAG